MSAPSADRLDATTVPGQLSHIPALDGLRGVAVLLVVLYHLSVARDSGPLRALVPGGFLGVDVFFVLSGFLITTLLLIDQTQRGSTVSLEFWIRRARRLLPALFVLLGLMAVYAWVSAPPWHLQSIRSEGLATLFYVQNWFLLFAHPAGGNLGHTWSLAIEEQWYVVWPFLLLGLFALTRGSRRGLLAAIAVLGAASYTWMVVLARRGQLARAHSGTDARAWELLAGAAIAVVLVSPRGFATRLPRRVVDAAGVIALAGLVGLALGTDDATAWFLRGGMVTVVALTAVALASAVLGGNGVAGAVLRFRPLVLLGLVSYGVYLFHIPLFLWITPARTGLDGVPLALARVAATLALAVASYLLVERPVRRWTVTGRRLAVLVPVGAVSVALLVAATLGARAMTPFDREAAYLQSRADAVPAGRARVLVFGSGTADLARVPGHEFSSEKVHAVPIPFFGCDVVAGQRLPTAAGSLGPPCPDWTKAFGTAVDAYRPHVAVLAAGPELALRVPAADPAGSAAWDGAITARLDDVREVLTRHGARMVILLVPCAGPAGAPPDVRERTATVNASLERFARRHPGEVRTADPGPVVCDAAGVSKPGLVGSDGRLTPTGIGFMWRWVALQSNRVMA